MENIRRESRGMLERLSSAFYLIVHVFHIVVHVFCLVVHVLTTFGGESLDQKHTSHEHGTERSHVYKVSHLFQQTTHQTTQSFFTTTLNNDFLPTINMQISQILFFVFAALVAAAPAPKPENDFDSVAPGTQDIWGPYEAKVSPRNSERDRDKRLTNRVDCCGRGVKALQPAIGKTEMV
jgi:hypothetical protein